MRLRVEAGRARTRTSVKVITIATTVFATVAADLQPRLPGPVRLGDRAGRARRSSAVCFGGGVLLAGAVAPHRARGAVPALGRGRIVIVPLLLGALVGGGAVAGWRLLFPAPPPLQAAIDRLNRRNELVGIATNRDGEPSTTCSDARSGSRRALVRDLGLDLNALEADLRLVGRPIEQHMAQKVLLGDLRARPARRSSACPGAGRLRDPLLLPVAGRRVVWGSCSSSSPIWRVRSEAGRAPRRVPPRARVVPRPGRDLAGRRCRGRERAARRRRASGRAGRSPSSTTPSR